MAGPEPVPAVSFVGVDLGGTKVAAAALADGELGAPVLRTTRLGSAQEVVDELAELVVEVRQPGLKAVGVGVPSIVEFATGRVVSSVNVPLADVALRHVLSDRLGVPVFVDNDATVAALAEAFDEQLRPVATNLVMLTIGTGVGGGLVLGGRIYRGSTGAGGELGHTIVGLKRDGAVPVGHHFPQPGSLEALASGHALDRLAAETARAHPDSLLGGLYAEGRSLGGADVVSAARQGDEAATRTLELWAERVGIGVANAINTFDPDEVVIGGGAAVAGDLLLEPATRVARAYIVPGLGERTTIRMARHGAVAGVMGAAMLAMQELGMDQLPEDGDAPTAGRVGANQPGGVAS